MFGNILFILAYGTVAVLARNGNNMLFCFLAFLPVLNIVCFIMDLRTYSKLNNPDPMKIIGTIQFTAILEIGTTATGNIISLITGVLIMAKLEKVEEIKKSNHL